MFVSLGKEHVCSPAAVSNVCMVVTSRTVSSAAFTLSAARLLLQSLVASIPLKTPMPEQSVHMPFRLDLG